MYILIHFLLFRILKKITVLTPNVTVGAGKFVRLTLFRH